MKSRILILLIIFQYSCTNSTNIDIQSVSRTTSEKLISNSLNIIDYFLKPVSITVLNSNQIVVVDEGKDYFLHLVNIKDSSCHVIQKSINKGNGPDEFLDRPIILTNQDKVWVHELNSKMITQLDKDLRLTKNTIPIPLETPLLYSLTYFDDQFVGKLNSTETNFITFDQVSQVIKNSELFPEIKENKSGDFEMFLRKSHLTVNSDRRLIAEAMEFYGLFNIYDTEGNIVNSISAFPSNYDDNLNYASIFDPEVRIYYIDIASDKDYIYALSLDKTRAYISQNSDDIQMTIDVFDWDANYIKTYSLDRQCKSIAVKDHTLYGINPSNEQTPIFSSLLK